MITKRDIEQRLQDLDWTLYRLAKEFAEFRANRAGDKEVPPASRYHTSLGKAIDNPGTSKLETIEDIVQVLNGELTITWEKEKVVSIRLEEETIEALKQRAENDGKTINDVTKQLLLQALLGLPVHQSKQIVMGKEAKIYRSFHPVIASAYSDVDQWLSELPEAKGYKELDYLKDISQSLNRADLKSIAFQFSTLFPRYYFEAVHILDDVIQSNRLLRNLKYNPRIFLLDIGSVMGAATTAFIDKILTLPKDDIQFKKLEVVCVGIDPNIYSFAIYKKLMEKLQESLEAYNIILDFKAFNQSLPQAMLSTIRHLQNKLGNNTNSSIKVLSNLFMMQLDLASSIGQDDILKRERNKKLKALGLDPEIDTEIEKQFWEDEILSLKRLLEEVPVEKLHLITIETKNLKNSFIKLSNTNNKNEGLNIIYKNLEKFMSEHKISYVLEGQQSVDFQNPVNSYWQDKDILTHTTEFNAICQTIKNSEIEEDNEWKKLISEENIEVAWVKARNNLFNESFYDEIEIRLFESNLDENLQILVDNLVDKLYTDNLLPSNQDIDYKFVKGRAKGRPKQLTRLEEEILAIAILQTIGNKKELNFSSYQIKLEHTEDLYEDYFPNYKKFLKATEESANFYQDGAVLRTDIQSYYAKVIQQQLIDITERELQITSKRIKWLLSKIIKQNLNNGHEDGVGLKQGTLTSGFYANLYLKKVDDYFNNKEWNNRIKFHRYVDDIIAVVRHENYLEPFETELKLKLKELGLNLNKDKTEHYEEISDFLPSIKLDTYLDELNKEFNQILYPLWIMNYDYRTQFELANSSHEKISWWKHIKIYRQCLYSLEIYVTEIRLSRKIYQKLVSPNFNNSNKLKFPCFPSNDNFLVVSKWSSQFQKLNSRWISQKNQIKSKVIDLFTDSLKKLREILLVVSSSTNEQQKRDLNIKRRRLETRIRASVNKLLILGFEPVVQEIVNLICDPDLFVIRDLLDVVIGLAYQGHTDAIKQIWQYYQNSEIATEEPSEYVRAILLEAFRFLPILESDDWELLFNYSITGKSDIEKLKATESWLCLGHIAKPFVQNHHLQNIVNALKSDTPLLSRIKKNYILILGMYNYELLGNIQPSDEESDDYLIKDALKLAESGKVLEIFDEVEPARVRQYYNVKKAEVTKDKLMSI